MGRYKTVDEDILWEILDSFHHGAKNKIEMYDLSTRMNMPARNAQRIIKTLIEDHNKPIASTQKNGGGYFIPETKEEKIEYINFLNKMVTSIARRMSCFDDNVREYFNNNRQINLIDLILNGGSNEEN